MTEVGIVLSNASAWSSSIDARELLRIAELVDRDSVWDCLWVGDSLLSVPRLEATVLLSACAARTSRIRLGVGCEASLGLREPILFALQWASLDVLSNGRMTLVACTGMSRGAAIERELAAFHLDHTERVERMEEVVSILRQASRQDVVDHIGSNFRLEDVRLRPTFVQRPLPIWMTANPSSLATPAAVRRVLRRVARLGDGWMTFALTPEQLAQRLTLLRQLSHDEERELPDDFPVCVYIDVNVDDDAERAMSDAVVVCEREGRHATAETLHTKAAIGSADACLSFIEPYVVAGATHIALRPVASNPGVQVERLSELVAPRIKGLVPTQVTCRG